LQERRQRYRTEQKELLEQSKRALVERKEQERQRTEDQRLELGRERLAEQKAERERKTAIQEWREKVRSEDAAVRKSKDKAKAFADIIKLASDQQEAKLTELAKKLDEDVASVSAEFADYRTAETASSIPEAMSEWDVERWPEPVATAVLLEELILCLSKHVVAKPHQVLVITLWVMLTWVHEEAAHHSPYLVITSPKHGCGKTTLLVDVIKHLVPKPVAGAAHNAANIYRVADRDKPTMLFDNVDKLLARKPDVAELFLYGYTRGIKVPREEKINGEWQTHWYDPFCPKACTLIGMKFRLPKDDEAVLASRTLPIELLPKKKGEEVPKKPFGQELLDEFANLRRKLARWSKDNATTLKSVTPAIPAAFFNRSADNWTLLWAIADLAGGDWAEQARNTAERLSQQELTEPSWLDLLLEELHVVFVEERKPAVTSAELIKRLTRNPLSVWRDYGRGHLVTQREIAALLRSKLHIHPGLVGQARLGGYFAKDFFEKEIFERFLGCDPPDSLILSPPQTTVKTKKPTRKRAKPRKRTK
jgi:hypothetical protein